MEPFEDLMTPLPEQVFEDFKGKWFVPVDPQGGKAKRFLLRESCNIDEYIFAEFVTPAYDEIEKFFFNSLNEAHEAAMIYYSRHNVEYPYVHFYLSNGGSMDTVKAIRTGTFIYAVGDLSVSDAIESQVMDFV